MKDIKEGLQCRICKHTYTHPYEVQNIKVVGECLGCESLYADALWESAHKTDEEKEWEQSL